MIVTGFFPPRPGGGSETLRALLHWLDPREYVVVTAGSPPDEARTTPVTGATVHRVSWALPVRWRGHQLVETLQIPLAAVRAARLARRMRCRVILGVCPDLQFMAVAYLAHRLTGLPLAVYLLDLIREVGHRGYLGALAGWLHSRIVEEARPLWAVTPAMVDHLRATSPAPVELLRHCYNEAIPDEPPAPQSGGRGLDVCFGGAVYDVNATSLARVVRAVGQTPGARLNICGPTPSAVLERHGLMAPHVRPGFFGERRELLAFLAAQDVLVACLSWPDESSMGVDELATIFSTKIREYLAQGRPILVHCPEQYFLARFMREHDCAWVVSERSEGAIAAALQHIQTDVVTRRRRCVNALAAARGFAGARVAGQFRASLAERGWGPRGSISSPATPTLPVADQPNPQR